MAFEPDLFFQRRACCTGPFARITPGPEDGLCLWIAAASGPFYWDRSEEDVSEDVTVWLWEPEEDVVDDETLPFA